ncbi:amidase [Pararhodobacter sp. CCB-MM2]|uniref:amidase n=1 Tax=Pararhodobacter sp. CCB-MM2 TaxID=1786003 RepID=UPI0008317A65|nr:amidase [Pararhodobacter sp. CCB-MM2]
MTLPETWHPLSLTALAAEIRAGLSPVALTEDCLDRIARHNPQIRALIHVDAEGARAAAATAEAELRSGLDRGPLHGIPVALKDVIDVAGQTTTGGSRLFDGTSALSDAACVASLRASGAVLIGKANLHELTAGTHDNPWFGKVVNPRDPQRGTAGTSSGSAAAVAAGFCALAVGSDTGGSNRSVAATTGLFGFKPSQGAVPSEGSLPTAPALDCLGPIAASVADIRAGFAALTGRAAPPPTPVDLHGLTIAHVPDLHGAEVDTTVKRALESWLGQCETHGVRVIELPFPDRAAFIDAGLTILLHDFARYYTPLFREDPDAVGAAAHNFLELGQDIDLPAYQAALAVRARAMAGLEDWMGEAELIVLPTAPGLAPTLGDETTLVNGKAMPFGLAGGAFRRWANMLAVPTLAAPLPTDGALPASVQLAARPGQDFRLLDLAEALGGWSSPLAPLIGDAA